MISVFNIVFADMQCHYNALDLDKNWLTMGDSCLEKMRDQINKEVDASIQYLALGAHFSRDVVNRPGFAKFFFESASEEREHAKQLISYLLTRGELYPFNNNLIVINKMKVRSTSWKSGSDALKNALSLEHNVTEHIKSVIQQCENSPRQSSSKGFPNDYHLVDYLTEFLGEQYKSMRNIAGKISTLLKLSKNEQLGEFLLDKQL